MVASSPRVFTGLLALLAAGMLILSFVLPPESLPAFPVCPLAALTGVPCFLCGTTHAVCAISHGRFAAAWRYNPAGYAAYGALAAFVAGWFVARRRPEAEQWVLASRAVRRGAWGVAGLVFVFGLARAVAVLMLRLGAG